MSLIPKPPFPNVPNLPGVPQLPRLPSLGPSAGTIVALGAAVGKLWQSLFSQPQWAIYKSLPPTTQDASGITTVTSVANRKPVVVPDSFGEFTFRNEWQVSDFPVQDGAFASYDKVATPFEVMLRLIKGGTKNDRKKFLDSIAAIAGTLDTYDIITPEKSFLNVNVVRYEISRRGPRGAYFLSEVDLYFRQIRTVGATYSNTAVVTQNAQSPSASPVTNVGSVLAKATKIKLPGL